MYFTKNVSDFFWQRTIGQEVHLTAGLNVDLGSFFELAELMVGMS